MFRASLLILFFLLSLTAAEADTITFRNATSLNGTVTYLDYYFTIHLKFSDGSTVSRRIPRADVEEVQLNDREMNVGPPPSWLSAYRTDETPATTEKQLAVGRSNPSVRKGKASGSAASGTATSGSAASGTATGGKTAAAKKREGHDVIHFSDRSQVVQGELLKMTSTGVELIVKQKPSSFPRVRIATVTLE